MTIVTKEKTAKIIPNAIGLMTVEHEKHVFSSFISRDTTFKLMTRLWKKAMRDLPQEELIVSNFFTIRFKLLSMIGENLFY